MHYKKTQISSASVFDGLHARLGQGHGFNLPAASSSSEVLFTQLEALSGARISQFSKSLAATFGRGPLKTQQSKADKGWLGISATGLQNALLQDATSYIKQSLKYELSGAAPFRAAAGGASQGQAIADFASMITRNIARNL